MSTFQLRIPYLGERILLAQDWTFHLYDEYRNETLTKELGYRRFSHNMNDINNNVNQPDLYPDISSTPWEVDNRMYKKKVTLPAGSVLSIKRIYIRQGLSDYDSITFNLLYTPLAHFCPKNGFKNMGGNKAVIPLVKGDKGRISFWAKLPEINDNLVCVSNFKGDFLP